VRGFSAANATYAALRAGMWLAALPPLGLARALGRGLGTLAGRLDARHRNIVLGNLRASFPERDEAWVEATARACFAHLGQVALEIPRLVTASPRDILARTRHHGLEHLEAARAKGRGVLALTGHLGNWE
jgi:Kdo2-lipid IVA lauroyltransferase/acyltransferase